MNYLKKRFLEMFGLPILGGVLATLSFPNPVFTGLDWGGGFLSLICLIPLLFIKSGKKRVMFWQGFTFGFIYYGISIIWIAGMESMAPLSPLAWILLTGYMACYPALFLVGYHFLIKQRIPWWLAATFLWVICEYARNYIISGFPWVSLGYAHYNNMFMAILPFAGIWGVSLVTVMINCIIYMLIVSLKQQFINKNDYLENKNKFKLMQKSYILMALLLVLIVSGSLVENYKLNAQKDYGRFYAAALQGSVNQNTQWNKRYRKATMSVYKSLLTKAATEDVALVIWPETAFPGIFNYDYQLAKTIMQWSKDFGMHQVVGSDEIELINNEYLYYNSMIMIDDQGKRQESTSKKHLVPFGEYVPYKDSILFFVHKIVKRYGGAGFTPGKKRTLLSFKKNGIDTKIGGIICFESIFPQYTRHLVGAGAGLLTVITYDTWFGHSAAAAQHAVFSSYRAAETGRYLIRAGANGISCIFNHKGKLLGKLSLDENNILVEQVRLYSFKTTYVKFGDWIVLLLIIITGSYWIIRRRIK